MRRGGDAASYLRMIERMRERAPAIAIRTTFIVGFPGEGEAEFARALPSSCGTRSSTTSERSPTRRSRARAPSRSATRFPTEEKERRKDFLLSLQQPIARGKLRSLRGREVEAIVEGPSEEHEYLLDGRLRSQAPEIDGRLLITDAGGRTLFPGDIVRVRIEKTFDYDVTGVVVGSARERLTAER